MRNAFLGLSFRFFFENFTAYTLIIFILHLLQEMYPFPTHWVLCPECFLNNQVHFVLSIYLEMCDLPLQWGWPIRGYTLKENLLSLPQNLGIASISSVWDSTHLHTLCCDFAYLECEQILSILWQHWICMCQPPCVSKDQFSCSCPPQSLQSYNISAPSSEMFSEPLGGGAMIEMSH